MHALKRIGIELIGSGRVGRVSERMLGSANSYRCHAARALISFKFATCLGRTKKAERSRRHWTAANRRHKSCRSSSPSEARMRRASDAIFLLRRPPPSSRNVDEGKLRATGKLHNELRQSNALRIQELFIITKNTKLYCWALRIHHPDRIDGKRCVMKSVQRAPKLGCFILSI